MAETFLEPTEQGVHRMADDQNEGNLANAESVPTATITTPPPAPPTPVANPAPTVNVAPAAAEPVADEAVTVEPELIIATTVEAPQIPAGVMGEVYPGDSGDQAISAVRYLSGRDDGIYGDDLVGEFMSRQQAAGLEANGVIAGESWALILPTIRRGALGHPRAMLLAALGVENTQFDEGVENLVKQIQEEAGLEPTGVVDQLTWFAIIRRAQTLV